MTFSNRLLHICTVASQIAEKRGYEPTGTSMVIKEPTSEHQKVVVGVHCRDIQAEMLHVVLLIINDASGRRLRCMDMHPGRGNWGGSLICEKCDAFYPSELPKRYSTKQTVSHNLEYDCEQHSLRISWADGQTVLSKEEARDLFIWLHDDLRDDLLAPDKQED